MKEYSFMRKIRDSSYGINDVFFLLCIHLSSSHGNAGPPGDMSQRLNWLYDMRVKYETRQTYFKFVVKLQVRLRSF